MIKALLLSLFLAGSALAQDQIPCVKPCGPKSPAFENGSTAAADVLATFDGTAQLLTIGYGTDTVNYPYALVATNYATGLRDPGMIKVGSTWFIAYTVLTPNVAYFQLISSTDLVNWSAPTNVSVTATVPTAQFVWAPRWFTDTDGSVHVFVSVSTVVTNPPGTSSNFQIYEMHPTGTLSLASTWSAPVLITVTGQTSIIDPQMTCMATGNIPCTGSTSGNTYYLWYTTCCFFGGGEYAQYSSSSTLTGTQTNVKTGDWAGWVCHSGGTDFGCEGLQLIYLGSKWRVVFDYVKASSGLTSGNLYFSDSTDGWATWSTKAILNSSPYQQAKHGTVLPYP